MSPRLALTLTLACAAALSATAQVVSGRIVDAADSSGVGYAAVGLPGTSSGTVANELGEFVIDAGGADSLLVYHLNYGTTVHALPGGSSPLVIALASRPFALAEVVVSDVSARDALNAAIERSAEALTLPAQLRTYYREFVKVNDTYTKYADGLVNYVVGRRGKSKLKIKAYVEDSRAAFLDDAGDAGELSEINTVLDVSDAPAFMLVAREVDFTNPDQQGYYDFERYVRRDGGTSVTLIKAIPKAGVGERLYGGQVVIDDATGLLREVTVDLSPAHRAYGKTVNLLVLKADVLDARKRLVFDAGGPGYHLAYALLSQTLRLYNGKGVDETFAFTSDLVVTDVLPHASSTPVAGEAYGKRALYKREAAPRTAFWRGARAMKLTPEQERVVAALQGEAGEE